MAIPLLYAMVLAFAVIGLVTIFVPLYLRSRDEIREAVYRRRCLLYFAMLGAGFILVEISLIQRLTIFLGHPTWSFVVVLTTLLLSSGLGSLFSSRWSEPAPGALAIVLAAIVGLVGAYAVFVYDRFIELMWLGRAARIALAAGVMAPAGFLMGMCFPLGVQIARRFHAALVPWGWAVNGAFSVFASVLSIALAIMVGFKATLVAGLVCYATALVIALSLRGREVALGELRGTPSGVLAASDR